MLFYTHAQTITTDNTHTHARMHTVLDPLKGAQHKHKHLMIVWSIKSLVFIHFDNLDEDLITCRFSRMSKRFTSFLAPLYKHHSSSIIINKTTAN